MGTFVENIVAINAARDFSSRFDEKADAIASGSKWKALLIFVANWLIVALICWPIVCES